MNRRNNTNQKHINEALTLMNSEIKDVFVDDLQMSIEQAIAKAKGEQHAVIESESSLTSQQKEKIDTLLTKILKRKVDTTYKVSPHLLAGFRVRVGDWKLDATLLHQLEAMKEILGGKSV